jgi:AcrR family transcriptional regulator
MTNDEAALPARVELAWGLRDHGRRGPKPGLTLERIVAAGIEVARTDGIAAVSMARVAGELGVGTMSLYRYVGAKDELISVMADTAFGAADLGPDEAGPDEAGPDEAGPDGWRAGLTHWADGLRASYRRNPWLLEVPVSATMLAPNTVSWMEAALRWMAGTPLPEQQKLSTALLLSGFVRNEATLSIDIAGAASLEFGATLARLTDEVRFPALHRAIASGSLDDDDDLDDEFDFGLQCILDGVAALIERHRPQQSRTHRR